MNKIIRLGTIAVTLVLIVFFAVYFVNNFKTVAHLFMSANQGLVWLACGANVLGTLVLIWVWPLTVRAFDPDASLTTLRGLIVGCYGWFARYVPGKVLAIASKIMQTRPDEANRAAVSSASVVNDLLNVGASFVLAPFFLYFFNHSEFRIGAWSMVLMLLSVLLMVLLSEGKHLQTLINWICKKLGATPFALGVSLSLWARFSILFWFCVSHLIRALGFAWLVMAFFDVAGVGFLMGVYILASALGILSVITPSGLGVKEGVLVAMLAPLVGLEISLLIAIIARIWEMLVDIVMLMVAWLFDQQQKKQRRVVKQHHA